MMEDVPSGHCFGCSLDNPVGLKLDIHPFEDGVMTEFTMDRRHESYTGIVHGGLVSTIVDEIMGTVIAATRKRLCCTTQLRTWFFAPLKIGKRYRATAIISSETPDGVYRVSSRVVACGSNEDAPLVEATGSYVWMTRAHVLNEGHLGQDFNRYEHMLRHEEPTP
ncbi:MAG: hotdog domain-containing protein [Myxococcota bacterium]